MNISDKQSFTAYICENLNILSEAYKVNTISNIVFVYKIRNSIATQEELKLFKASSASIKTHTISKLEIPISLDPKDYGDIISKSMLNNNT